MFWISAKEKAEAKPRQHTIDLSQMAVPIQMPPERRQSPEPSGQAAGEPETPGEAAGISTIHSTLFYYGSMYFR